VFETWQAHDELATPVWARTAGRNRPIMKLEQAPRECKTNAQATLSPLNVTTDLHEQVEDADQHLRRNADPVIARRSSPS
jgi:hypothetical protein